MKHILIKELTRKFPKQISQILKLNNWGQSNSHTSLFSYFFMNTQNGTQ